MNIRLKSFTKTIFHEIGHCFGYCLANMGKDTFLGNVDILSLGTSKSCVGTTDSLYHCENILGSISKIKESTANKERTIAWFIEVVSGCTFQSLFENTDFKDCFGIEKNKSGNKDYSNIRIIRGYSSFEFTMSQIFDLQKEYEQIIKKHQILAKFNSLSEHIKKDILNSKTYQVNYTKEEINYFINGCLSIITDEIYEDYINLINKYSEKMPFKIQN